MDIDIDADVGHGVFLSPPLRLLASNLRRVVVGVAVDAVVGVDVDAEPALQTLAKVVLQVLLPPKLQRRGLVF